HDRGHGLSSVSLAGRSRGHAVQLRKTSPIDRAWPGGSARFGTKMNIIRGIMTLFLLVVAAANFLGWRWAATLPAPMMEAARIVLTLAAVVALIGIAFIWSIKLAARPNRSESAASRDHGAEVRQ